MARVPSNMAPLGMEAPPFSLADVRTGRSVSRADFPDRTGLLVMFICNHCPFVKHMSRALAEFGREYEKRGLGIVAISSNDLAAQPDDGPEEMKDEAETIGYTFPYCFDADAGGGESVPGRVHPRLLSLRPEAAIGLPGSVRCEPAEQRDRPHRGRSARGRRRGARGTRAGARPDAQRRLQHQVEAGEPACLAQPGIAQKDERHRGLKPRWRPSSFDCPGPGAMAASGGDSADRWIGYQLTPNASG